MPRWSCFIPDAVGPAMHQAREDTAAPGTFPREAASAVDRTGIQNDRDSEGLAPRVMPCVESPARQISTRSQWRNGGDTLRLRWRRLDRACVLNNPTDFVAFGHCVRSQ